MRLVRIDELAVHSKDSGAKTLTGLSIYGSRTLLPCCRPALCLLKCVCGPHPQIPTSLR